MKITVDDLARLDACEEGIAAFSEVFPDGYEGEWCAVSQALALGDARTRPFLGWAWAVGLLPAWSMCLWNLSRANLRGADLSGANLRGADLYGANLRGADLCGADLSGANLRGADLCGADLSGADLSGADLSRANLYGAYLGGADLRGADGMARLKE